MDFSVPYEIHSLFCAGFCSEGTIHEHETNSCNYKPVLKAVIIFAEFFKKVFTGTNVNFASCLNIILEFNFTCSNTLELNCADSLIHLCAKLSSTSGIYSFYFLQNDSVTITRS